MHLQGKISRVYKSSSKQILHVFSGIPNNMRSSKISSTRSTPKVNIRRYLTGYKSSNGLKPFIGNSPRVNEIILAYGQPTVKHSQPKCRNKPPVKKPCSQRVTPVENLNFPVDLVPRARKGSVELNKEKRLVEFLKHEILSCKSDKLELMRDLATYEINMSDGVELLVKLGKLQSEQHMVSKLLLKPDGFIEFKDRLNEGMGKLMGISHEMDTRVDVLESENYEVHPLSPFSKISHAFDCVRKISGVYCVISVNSDSLFSNFILSLSLPSKLLLCLNQQFQLSIRDYEDKVAIKEEIENKILTSLYMDQYESQLEIKWDVNYRKTFLNLFVNIKSLKIPKMVQITESAGAVLLTYVEAKQCVAVSRSLITDKSSVIECSDEYLVRILSKHLRYEAIDDVIIWATKPHKIHSAKEKVSDLMNMKYVLSTLGSFSFQVCKEITVNVDGNEYLISVLAFADIEKIEICYKDDKRIVNLGSSLGRWISDLQFIRFKESPLTILKSLETKNLIRFLFHC